MNFIERLLSLLHLKKVARITSSPEESTPEPEPSLQRETEPTPPSHLRSGQTIHDTYATSTGSRKPEPSDPFHHFFTWLEDDPEYKKIYRKIERASKSVCLSCKQSVDAEECLPLHSPLVLVIETT